MKKGRSALFREGLLKELTGSILPCNGRPFVFEVPMLAAVLVVSRVLSYQLDAFHLARKKMRNEIFYLHGVRRTVNPITWYTALLPMQARNLLVRQN